MTVRVDAEVSVVEALETLVMALRASPLLSLQRPMIIGSIPSTNEPTPSASIEPNLASSNRVPEPVGTDGTADGSIVLAACVSSSLTAFQR